MKYCGLLITRLTSLALLLLLTGCGFQTATISPNPDPIRPTSTAPVISRTSGQPTPTSPATATATRPVPTATVTPLAVPQGEIVLWEQMTAEQGAWLRDNIEAFQKLYPAVQFNVRHLEGENRPAQFDWLGSEKPQIVIAPAAMAGEWQRAQFILPLEKLFEINFLDRFEPGVLQGLRDENKLWGLPFNFGNTLLLFYNKRLISPDKVPPSWEAMTTFVRANPARKGEYYPFAVDLYDPNFLLLVLSTYGGSVFDQTGQIKLDTEPMRQSLQFLQDAIFKNKLVSVEPNYLQMQLLFRTGQLAMIMSSSENLTDYQKAEWSNRLDIGVAQIPRINGRAGTLPGTGLAYFVGAKAADDASRLAAVRLFLSFMSQPDQQRGLTTRLKQLPPTRAGLSDPVITGDPLLAAIATQIRIAQAVPPSPAFKIAIEAMRQPITGVVASRANATEGAAAMQEAVAQLEQSFKKRN